MIELYLRLQSHYPVSIPISMDHDEMCSYGIDALHGHLESSMNGNDWESSCF